MRNFKAFITILMPLMMAHTVGANEASFSVKGWEDSLKASLASGKTDVTPFFTFTKIEKDFLSYKNNSERKLMQEARDLYAKGKFEAAIAKYNQIQKGSDYWLEAVEEKGWAFHLQDKFEKSLAQTKTLLSEPLVQVIGTEPFFLQSLSQLKICDYTGIFATHQTFKDSQKSRIAAIEAVSKTGSSPALDKVVEKISSFPVTFSQVGNETKDLPRLFFRDLDFQKRLLQVKLTSRGIALIQERMNVAPEAEKAKLQSSVSLLQKAQVTAAARMKERMKSLAEVEDKRNQLILQKLGLIEVETIQRMHADKEMDSKDFSNGKFAKVTKNELVFPDDGYPWIDELDKFEVSANACPRNVRRKM